MRRAADLCRLAIAVACAAFLFEGDGEAALKALLMLGPAVAPRLLRVPPALDLVFVAALAAEAIGTGLGDTFAHLVLPLLSAPVLYVASVRLTGASPRRPGSLAGAALVTAALVLALGIAWEGVEWAADRALGTDYTRGEGDTRADLRNDAAAAAAGGVLVAVWLRVAPESLRLGAEVKTAQ
jgi:hypothetical protein